MKKILLSAAFFCSLIFSYAQSGKLDPTFGSLGIVRTDMGSPVDYNSSASQVFTRPDGSVYIIFNSPTFISKRFPNGSIDSSYGYDGYSRSVPYNDAFAALQPDGKIVIAGVDELGSPGIARINANGLPDEAFGNNSVQTISFIPLAVTVQSNGKIVVAGGAGNGFVTARFNVNGTADFTFNGSGQVTTDFVYKLPPGRGGGDSTEVHSGTAYSVAEQADGKIVVGGYALTAETGTCFAIARYNSNGKPDISFDYDGKRTTLIGAANAIGYSLAIQNDKKIVLAGYAYDGATGNKFAVARYNINGSPDNSFNGNGLQTANLGSDMTARNSAAIQSNGKIVVAGYTLTGTNNDFAVARFNTNGSLDNSFDNDGLLTTDIGGSDDYAGSVAIQANDKILVAGYSYNGSLTTFAVTKYNANGSLDNSYGTSGKLKGTASQGHTEYNSSAVQANGKIVVAGETWNGTNYDFAVTRYNANGSFDKTFSGDGKQTTDFGATDQAVSVAIQADGKIIVAGKSDTQFAIARYNANGSLDNTFSGDGKLVFSMGFADDARAVAVQADGKIVMVGYTFTDSNYDSAFFAIARLNTNGTFDNSFSGDGKQFTDFDGSPGFAAAVGIQKNGKIVVGGRSYSNNQNYFALTRYNVDGSLDLSFSQDGKQTDVFGPDSYTATSLAIQSDGKIIMAGYSESVYTGSASIEVARYKTNGGLDSTFNKTGFQINYPGVGSTVAISNDGRIAVGGTNDDYTLALYKSNGTPDSTFGTNGIQTTGIGVGNSSIKSLVFSNNKLYAAGNGEFPGSFGVVARYLFCGCQTLPVTLLDFSAAAQQKTVLLQWQAENEENLSGYGIERSANGNTFSPIGYLAVKGKGKGKINYASVDQQPLQGLNFYRLKMVDLDGKFTYSKIVSVYFNDAFFTWQIFPNPAKDVLFVSAVGEAGKGSIQIMDACGRKLKEMSIILTGKTSISLNIHDLPKGMYIFQLRTNTKTETRRFIKE